MFVKLSYLIAILVFELDLPINFRRDSGVILFLDVLYLKIHVNKIIYLPGS